MNHRDDANELTHIALAVEGCSWNNPDYFALMVANTVSKAVYKPRSVDL